MSTLLELRAQVDKIQKQMFDIKARDRSKVMAEMVENMDAYEISIRDLQIAARKTAKGATASKAGKTGNAGKAPKTGSAVSGGTKGTLHLKKPRADLKPKYQGPNGEMWSGRGVMPKWIRGLIAAGQPREAFLIKDASDATNADAASNVNMGV